MDRIDQDTLKPEKLRTPQPSGSVSRDSRRRTEGMDIPRKGAARRRRIRRTVLGLSIVSVVAAVSVGVSSLERAAPSVKRSGILIDAVKRGPMVRQVRGPGKLVPKEITWISAATGGRIERLPLLPGIAVKPDTTILELSSPELIQAALDSEWAFKSAKAGLASQKALLQNELLQMKAAVARLNADQTEAQLQQEVDEKLFADELISERKLKLSRARVVELGKLIEIEEKRLKIKEASQEDQLAVVQARMEQARALEKFKKEQVKSLRVLAGTEGVLEQLDVQVGQRVTPGTILAKVTNPKRLKAVLKIPEVQAREVMLGQKVSVDTRSTEVPGHVVRIDPAVVDGTVAVDVTLDAALPKGARPDLSITGTIEIERLDDVLYVGRPVFGQAESTVSLFRINGDGTTADRIRVSLGRSSVSTIEVVDGLKVGDQVITSDMSQWDAFNRIGLR